MHGQLKEVISATSVFLRLYGDGLYSPCSRLFLFSWRSRPEMMPLGRKVGDPVMVVESDKADMDVESFEEGYLAAVLTEEGGSAKVGSPVALIVERYGGLRGENKRVALAWSSIREEGAVRAGPSLRRVRPTRGGRVYCRASGVDAISAAPIIFEGSSWLGRSGCIKIVIGRKLSL